jgi:hypothetical protein
VRDLRAAFLVFTLRAAVFFEAFRFTDFFLVVFFAAFFLGGTFLPSLRASDSQIAIACFRLFTVYPEPPLFKVPALRLRSARPTFADAVREYFRAMMVSPLNGNQSRPAAMVPR